MSQSPAPLVTDIVVVGASAGGVEVLRSLVAGLPPDLAAAVVVVLHIPRDAPSALPAILERAGPLPARPAAHAQRLQPGTIFVAPADRHVLVVDGYLHLSRGPVENGHRPAIDPLFRSAGTDFGAHAVGVVLSGNRDDGSAGLVAIARHGGACLVQEPADALYPDMPRSALAAVPSAKPVPAADLGAAIAALIPRRADGPATGPDPLLAAEVDIAAVDPDASTVDLDGAVASPLSCPDCDGVLFQLPGAPHPRFRCRVGHAWSPVSLVGEHETTVDVVLWSALRALEEKAALLRWLADDASAAGRQRSAARHRDKAAQAGAEAAVLRRMLTSEGGRT
ncbi:chemotaxis protein CheB [Pseudonocardia sp. CA-107938]|uniref:chemotaxis protein CheB n=1 Tax=Pseudonocardia sp. CA-107938 TaxID=3240021 RepID=UPI003D8A5789